MWVAGDSQHLGEKKAPDSLCCPDFSCCVPELAWPLDLRRKFYEADEQGRFAMLQMSLQHIVDYATKGRPDVKVYIAGESHQ